MGSIEVLIRLDIMKNGNLDISYLDLTELPESELWKKVIHLSCSNNELTTLPELPLVRSLYCSYNRLIALPELPSIKILSCPSNRLTSLPELPNVKQLNCCYNQITELPELPSINNLLCRGNQLRFYSGYYKYIHQIRKVTIALSVIKQWRKFNQESVRNKKQDLHNELLYSPDLPFYLQQPEAQHWFDQIN